VVDAAHSATPESATLSSAVLRTVDRATRDLASMRLYDLTADGGWATSAGIPEFMALYGRDSICSSWQASLLSTAMLRGTMPVLASLQGNVNDAWRDEEPDKMIHQAANGMLSHLDYNPFKRYYG